jgi:tRNA-guanine family transglycosylase
MISCEYHRSFRIEISNKTIETPFFFPAISSVNANYTPVEYLNILFTSGYPGFLLSTYDIYNSTKNERGKIYKILSDSFNDGTVVLLDSGNFESYWHGDKKWNISAFKSILKDIEADLCLSFDIFWQKSKSIAKQTEQTISNVAKTASFQRTGLTIPIIHSEKKHLPTIAKDIIKKINPEIISIPERELGLSIFERAETIQRIREEMDKTGKPAALHLLGTGNPLSILIYSICGADTFDALEWYKYLINRNDGRLLDFSHADLIECSCQACNEKKAAYPARAMAHNLIFYLGFMEKIRNFFKTEKINDLLSEYLTPSAVKRVREIARLT